MVSCSSSHTRVEKPGVDFSWGSMYRISAVLLLVIPAPLRVDSADGIAQSMDAGLLDSDVRFTDGGQASAVQLAHIDGNELGWRE